jgi:hypothetical protein
MQLSPNLGDILKSSFFLLDVKPSISSTFEVQVGLSYQSLVICNIITSHCIKSLQSVFYHRGLVFCISLWSFRERPSVPLIEEMNAAPGKAALSSA